MTDTPSELSEAVGQPTEEVEPTNTVNQTHEGETKAEANTAEPPQESDTESSEQSLIPDDPPTENLESADPPTDGITSVGESYIDLSMYCSDVVEEEEEKKKGPGSLNDQKDEDESIDVEEGVPDHQTKLLEDTPPTSSMDMLSMDDIMAGFKADQGLGSSALVPYESATSQGNATSPNSSTALTILEDSGKEAVPTTALTIHSDSVKEVATVPKGSWRGRNQDKQEAEINKKEKRERTTKNKKQDRSIKLGEAAGVQKGSESDEKTGGRWKLCAALFCLLLLLGSAAGVTCGLGYCKGETDGSRGESISQSGGNGLNNLPTVNGTPTSPEYTGPIKPIENTFELISAVDKVLSGQNVPMYGATIGDWDVSAVTDFATLFSADRTGTTDFNEDLSSWNMANAESLEEMFIGQEAFEGKGLETWDVAKVTTMRGAFERCTMFQSADLSAWQTDSLEDISFLFSTSGFAGDVSNWNTAKVVDMSYAFFGSPFNSDLSKWKVDNVKDLSYMFNEAPNFDQDLSMWQTSSCENMAEMFEESGFTGTVGGGVSTWDTSKVVSMSSMFDRSEFVGNVSNWDTSSCTDMARMFRSTFFEGDVSRWNVEKVTTMYKTFSDTYFNGDLSAWNTSSVVDFSRMFEYADSFVGTGLEGWDVANAESIESMFYFAWNLQADLSAWQTGNVNDFSFAFYGCEFYNDDLSAWDTSKATTMQSMFNEASEFKSALYWNTSSVVDMAEMFEESGITGEGLEGWDVSRVMHMNSMFDRALSFKADLSSWNVSSLVSADYMFNATGVTADLCAWDMQMADDAEVTGIFANTACPEPGDPVPSAGPWCHECFQES